MRSEQAILLFYLGGRIRRHLLNIEQRSDDCRQPIAKLCTEAVLEIGGASGKEPSLANRAPIRLLPLSRCRSRKLNG